MSRRKVDPRTLPAAEGGWPCIVADPPWWFDDQGSRATPYYEFMPDEAILAMPVADIAAPRSHLYLWAPDAHILSGLAAEVARRWGYVPTHFIHWIKRAPAFIPGGPPGAIQMGMGHYFRRATESCLFCVRGTLPPLRHNQVNAFEAPDPPSNLIEAPRGGHSVKPEKLQDIAETMTPGPRLELFARRSRPGWVCWGHEAA